MFSLLPLNYSGITYFTNPILKSDVHEFKWIRHSCLSEKKNHLSHSCTHSLVVKLFKYYYFFFLLSAGHPSNGFRFIARLQLPKFHFSELCKRSFRAFFFFLSFFWFSYCSRDPAKIVRAKFIIMALKMYIVENFVNAKYGRERKKKKKHDFYTFFFL